jgi:class 3 adenylate cyclase
VVADVVGYSRLIGADEEGTLAHLRALRSELFMPTIEAHGDAVLSRKSRALPAVARTFDGAAEARLIALACSQPPEGHARWSLRLLESKAVELGIVERARDTTIQRTLEKTRSSRIAASTGSFRRRRAAHS